MCVRVCVCVLLTGLLRWEAEMKKCERSERIKEERMKVEENVLLVWSCMQYEADSPASVVSSALESGVVGGSVS